MPFIYCITNGNKKISPTNQRILADLKELFRDEFQIYKSSDGAAAIQQIHTLKHTCTHLIGVGGDGTFNVLVNGVCTHPDANFPRSAASANQSGNPCPLARPW